MSTLFADTMRSALVANATGFIETPEARATRLAEQERFEASRVGLCSSEFDFYEDSFLCDLPNGHDGDHGVRREDEDGTWELRWRPKG